VHDRLRQLRAVLPEDRNIEAATVKGYPKSGAGKGLRKGLQIPSSHENVKAPLVKEADHGRLAVCSAIRLNVEEDRLIQEDRVKAPVLT